MASQPEPSHRRSPARPIPGAEWQGQVASAGEIIAELQRLWLLLGDLPHPHESPWDEIEPPSAGVLLRASTLNLIAIAASPAVAERVEIAVSNLSDLSPSRVTILVAETGNGSAAAPGLWARVALLEQETDRGRPAVRYESIIVAAGAGSERHLASLVAPLLVADLPDFLYWTRPSVLQSELLSDLAAFSDRLIVDSGTAKNVGVELRHHAAMLTRVEDGPKLSDFAWSRLTPWRHLIAQFFDPPALAPLLDVIDSVTITFSAPDADGRSGFTAALLLAGWLGSCLGWITPGEVVSDRDEPGGWRVTLRGGSHGRRREILLRLQPILSKYDGPGLLSVTLSARGPEPMKVRVERLDDRTLATSSEAPSLAPIHRVVHATIPDETSLLAGELAIFGRDQVYEAALTVAATLAPHELEHGGER